MADKKDDTPEVIKDPATKFGVADGELVTNILGESTGETVVYDKDKDGQVTGWHKEVKNG